MRKRGPNQEEAQRFPVRFDDGVPSTLTATFRETKLLSLRDHGGERRN